MIIYKTTDLTNGLIYIGQTFRKSPNYLGSGKKFSKEIKLKGKENFIREILCECTSKKELDEKEIYYISLYDSTNPLIGYNLSPGGQSNRWLKMTPEQIKRNSERNTLEKNPMFGKTHSKKSLEKMKEKKKGVNNPRYGKEVTENMRKTLSDSMKNSERLREKLNRPYIQEYDLNMNLIKEWPSRIEIKKKLGIKVRHLNECCDGVRPSINGKIFKYRYLGETL